MRLERGQISFDVPNGRLVFGPGELDVWAEHLAWCYRFLGIGEGATIAVQDFGASPLSFLGSSSLMPSLQAGVAERLNGRVICLDASRERVVLTPALCKQVALDALVVRAEVLGLLAEVSARAGVDLGSGRPAIVVAFDQEVPRFAGQCSTLLHVESSLLLAPQCMACGCLHLRRGFYQLTGDRVVNLRSASAAPCHLRLAEGRPVSCCSRGHEDWQIRLAALAPS